MVKKHRICRDVLVMAWFIFFITTSLAVAATFEEREGQFEQFLRAGQYKEAMPLAQEMLATAEQTAESNGERHARALERVGMTYRAQADSGQARTYYERALAVYEKQPAKDEIAIAGIMNDLGLICLNAGDQEAAEGYYTETIERYRKAGCTDKRLGKALENLGDMYNFSGKPSRAITPYEEALEVYTKYGGEKSPDAVRVTELLANLYLMTGNNAKAEEFCLKGVGYYREHPFEGYSPKIGWFTKVGDLYSSSGRYAEAVPYYIDTADAYQSIYKMNDARAIKALSQAAQACRRSGDNQKAKSIESRIDAIRGKQKN